MAHLLERRQERQSSTRRGIRIDSSKYGRSEEGGSSLDVWAALSNTAALRQGVARDFAARAMEEEGVREVWITEVTKDLHVAVALTDPTLEVELRKIFISLVCERLDASEGSLFVFAEEIADWVKAGQRLA
jgi:hypothetical protein